MVGTCMAGSRIFPPKGW